jgi:predicted TIM-barrel fold metal-dependent hydrolase
MNDPVSYPLWKKAEELGSVVDIFLAPQQLQPVGHMAERFPGVNIVIYHLATIDITAPDTEGFRPLLALRKFPNVYVRTSLHSRIEVEESPVCDVGHFCSGCTMRSVRADSSGRTSSNM